MALWKALYRALRPKREPFRCPAQRHCRWSAAIDFIVATVPRCAREFRFVCGVSVGSSAEGRVVGILWGHRGPPQEALPAFHPLGSLAVKASLDYLRSEERRVGKESGQGWQL